MILRRRAHPAPAPVLIDQRDLDLAVLHTRISTAAERHRPTATGSGPVRCPECLTLGICDTYLDLTGAVAR